MLNQKKFEVGHHPRDKFKEMDISKPPNNSGNKIPPQANVANRQQAAISSIQDLKLEAGKVYSGTVINSKQPLPQPNDSNAEAPTANKEWLVQVKGQTIVISSDKLLENGQKLLLKLDPSSTVEKPSLIAQLINSKPSISTPQSSTSLAQALSNVQSHDSITKTHTSTSFTNNAQFDKSLINPLLQALNITLDKQLPLQQGFEQISSLLLTLTANSQSTNVLKSLNIEPKLIESIKQLIIDRLPKLNDIIQTNQSPAAAQTSGNYIKQSLSNSGLFFEKSLLSNPTFLNTFRDQLNNLNQGLNQTNTLQSQLPSLSNQAPSQSPSQSINAARDKIQQTIEALLQLASNTQTKLAPTNSETPQQITDLKASLISASALLAKQLASDISESELKSLFLGHITDSQLASPFVFPMLNNMRPNQSKSLFDAQEFSTGQLLKLLAGMIHKLQFNQLNSLLQSNTSGDNALQQTWFFELPILNPNQTVQTFNFRLDKEQKESGNKQDETKNELQWKLLLSFDLASLGAIYVQVTLSNTTISPILWADQQDTLALLEKESAYFKDQLESIGLDVSDIICQKGQPSSKHAQLDRHLVDTKV